MRNPAGDTLRRIAVNPRIAFLYRNPAQRQMWQFHGRARIVDDPEARDAIFEGSHKRERDRDPDRLGVAVIIDLDRVLERGAVLMGALRARRRYWDEPWRRRGSATSTVRPPSGSARAVTSPRWARTIARTIESPRP